MFPKSATTEEVSLNSNHVLWEREVLHQRKTLQFLLTKGVTCGCLRFANDNKGKQAIPLLNEILFAPACFSPPSDSSLVCARPCEPTSSRCPCGVAPPWPCTCSAHLLCATSAAGSHFSCGPIETLSQTITFCFHHILFEMKGSKESLRRCSGAPLRGPLTTVRGG